MKLKLIRLAQHEFEWQAYGVPYGSTELQSRKEVVKLFSDPFFIREKDTVDQVAHLIREAVNALVHALIDQRYDLVQITPLGFIDVDFFHFPEHRAYSVKVWAMGYKA